MSNDKLPAGQPPRPEHDENPANPIEKAGRYCKEVRHEMTQVSWPTWNQVRSTALVVLFFTFAMTVFVTAIDWIAKFFYHLAGGK